MSAPVLPVHASPEALVAAAPVPHDEGTEIARGVGVNVATLVAANLRSVFTFLIARVLGGPALAIFGTAWATLDALSKVAIFGLEEGITPLVARARRRGDDARALGLLRTAAGAGAAIATATALTAYLVLQVVAGVAGWIPEVTTAVSLILLALPAMAVYRISSGFSRGLKLMRHTFWSRGITETWVTLLSLVTGIGLGLGSWSPEIAVIAGMSAAACVAWTLASRTLRRPPSGIPVKRVPAAEVLRFSSPIAGYNLVNVLIERLDVLLLGAWAASGTGASLGAVGFYFAASEIAGGTRKVRQAFDPMFSPVMAMHSEGEHAHEGRAAARQVSRWFAAALMPLILLPALAGGLMLAIFGNDFRAAWPALVLLVLAHGLNSYSGLQETLIMVHRPRTNLRNSLLAIVLQLGTAWLLIPRLGTAGAAASALLAYVLLALLRTRQLPALTGWRWPWDAVLGPLAAGALAVLPAGVILVLFPSLWGQLAGGLVWIAAYLSALRLGLDERDRAALRSLWRAS